MERRKDGDAGETDDGGVVVHLGEEFAQRDIFAGGDADVCCWIEGRRIEICRVGEVRIFWIERRGVGGRGHVDVWVVFERSVEGGGWGVGIGAGGEGVVGRARGHVDVGRRER